MSKTKINPEGFPTDQQITEWKKEHGKVHAFADSDDNVVVIMRTPKLKDIERANASDPTGKKSFNFNRSILENCSLWIKDGVKDDDGLLMGIFENFPALINIVEVKVKEL